MIWGIHYFITKLKTKFDVIPRSCFNQGLDKNQYFIDKLFSYLFSVYKTIIRDSCAYVSYKILKTVLIKDWIK